MKNSDAHALRSIRRLNRRVHDPISDWLGAALAAVVSSVWPRASQAPYPPERQDLYGFSSNDCSAVAELPRSGKRRS